MARRRLIVNADDFGVTDGVNAGIVEAFQNGILRSTSLMANGPAFDDAVRLARRHPQLDVGCHLVLISGQSAAAPHDELPRSLPHLLARLAGGFGVAEAERELAAQVEKLRSAGIQPTHLDTHKHTHLAPPVLGALLRVARRFAIPWIRRPFDLPLTAARGEASWTVRAVAAAAAPLRRGFDRKLRRHGLRATDYFAGFQLTGRFRTAELIRLLHALPEGTTEFMCHPGRCTPDLVQAETRLKESREDELEALTDPAVKKALAEARIELIGFRDL